MLSVIDRSDRDVLKDQFRAVRALTEKLCRPLEIDDYQIQSIDQTSPPKWHIAHVTWFFETFILGHFKSGYTAFNPAYDFLFNSYYYTHGQVHPRSKRGLLSRPSVEEIYHYRAHVDTHIKQLIETIGDDKWDEFAFCLTLGLHHEQQHQELLLMDIKHNLFSNPLQPAYRQDLNNSTARSRPVNWVERHGGRVQIGQAGTAFHYDNETPRHDVLTRDHLLADRLVNNGEYLEFIEDGGYENPVLWLSDGWELVQKAGWTCPLYWTNEDNDWKQFTLSGTRDLNHDDPVSHLSYYEAEAYACWSGKRLPLEAELETMEVQQAIEGNFMDGDYLHPVPAGKKAEWYGNLWTWTASPYQAYPGFKPLAGTIGEYNGKFMSNQMVLKGGSCVTPQNHIRASYRNFFYPAERWAFTGLRLAEDGS